MKSLLQEDRDPEFPSGLVKAMDRTTVTTPELVVQNKELPGCEQVLEDYNLPDLPILPDLEDNKGHDCR